MGFSKGNKYLGRARLVDEAGHARAGLHVAVIVRECKAEQTERTIAAGIVGETGQVELELEAPGESALIPAFELVGILDGERRWLATSVERIVVIDAIDKIMVFDFGTLVVADRPFATVGGRPLHGLPSALANLLTATRTELDVARARVTELEGPGAPVMLDAVVEGIGSQLGAVEGTLAAARSPYRLSRVSLDLKLVPSTSADGTTVSFLGREDLRAISGEAVSTIELDFMPRSPASAAAATTVSVPDFCGDTEVMARRRASGVGLSLDVLQRELPADQAARAGQVVKQLPTPGSLVQPGARITLLIGKVSRQV